MYEGLDANNVNDANQGRAKRACVGGRDMVCRGSGCGIVASSSASFYSSRERLCGIVDFVEWRTHGAGKSGSRSPVYGLHTTFTSGYYGQSTRIRVIYTVALRTASLRMILYLALWIVLIMAA